MRVLVVEDEPDLAKALTEGIRRDGYAVDTALTGEEALDKVLKGAIYKPKSVIPLPLSFNLTSTEKDLKNYNPFVKRLCRLFSQAKFNNAGTRGLEEKKVDLLYLISHS